jgi:predicted sulfurtransferase
MSLKPLILFAAITLAACNAADTKSTTATAPTPAPTVIAHQSDNTARVTTTELEQLMKDGKVVVVDVRNKASYDLGHIRGAKLIPVTEIGARADELPRDKMIVTYCS